MSSLTFGLNSAQSYVGFEMPPSLMTSSDLSISMYVRTIHSAGVLIYVGNYPNSDSKLQLTLVVVYVCVLVYVYVRVFVCVCTCVCVHMLTIVLKSKF